MQLSHKVAIVTQLERSEQAFLMANFDTLKIKFNGAIEQRVLDFALVGLRASQQRL